jgi:hypothetical protein
MHTQGEMPGERCPEIALIRSGGSGGGRRLSVATQQFSIQYILGNDAGFEGEGGWDCGGGRVTRKIVPW